MGSACEHGIGPSKQTHFRWGNDKSSRACKNWIYKAKDQFNEFGLSQYCDISNPIPKSFSNSISDKMMEKFEPDCSSMLNTVGGKMVVINFARINYSKWNLK